jgi:hypothetical protein
VVVNHRPFVAIRYDFPACYPVPCSLGEHFYVDGKRMKSVVGASADNRFSARASDSKILKEFSKGRKK